MPKPLDPASLPAIAKALKLFKASSFITGGFLLLLMLTWGLRRLENVTLGAFTGFELWAFGPNGVITLEPYVNEGQGLPETGLNLTVFRMWTLMRWNFSRFLFIAAGGIVPFLSFYTERRYAKIAADEMRAAGWDGAN